MFEGQPQAEIDALIKSDPEFKQLYQRHRTLDKKVTDAELGVLPIESQYSSPPNPLSQPNPTTVASCAPAVGLVIWATVKLPAGGVLNSTDGTATQPSGAAKRDQRVA